MPKYTVSFSAVALLELREISAYLDAQRQGLGFDFGYELTELVFRLENNPGIYQFVNPTIQRGLIGKFKYVAFYQVRGVNVEIIRLVHGRSDIEYFR